jgi:hypothetical protein
MRENKLPPPLGEEAHMLFRIFLSVTESKKDVYSSKYHEGEG